MIDILRIIVGLPLALFIPGYLMTLLFFDELEALEKIAIGFVLSICVDIALGLFLGYNEHMKDLTGGITAKNLWFYLSFITILLGSGVMYRWTKDIRNRKRLLKKLKYAKKRLARINKR